MLCMRSKAWLAARVSLRLARLPRTASSAQCSRRLRSTRAAAPVLLAHAVVTKNIIFFSMGPKFRYCGIPQHRLVQHQRVVKAEQQAQASVCVAAVPSRSPTGPRIIRFSIPASTMITSNSNTSTAALEPTAIPITDALLTPSITAAVLVLG